MKNKLTRNRYFQVLIYLGINLIKCDCDFMNNNKLVKLLVKSGFITQEVLMNTLYNLRIEYEGKILYFKDFNVQLEKNIDGSLFWNIFLETNIVTTKRFLAKLFSSELLSNKNGIDDRLKIYSLSEFKKPNRRKLFLIDTENCQFFPGFFSRSFLEFQELSKKEEVKELLEINRRK